MARIFRNIEAGTSSYALWIEDSGERATFTIDSTPYRHIEMGGFTDAEKEESAILLFRKWLVEHGINPDECRGTLQMLENKQLQEQLQRNIESNELIESTKHLENSQNIEGLRDEIASLRSEISYLRLANSNHLFFPKMVSIPGGEFLMGTNDTSPKQNNLSHRVRLDSFEMSIYPITVKEYISYCMHSGEDIPKAPSFNSNWSYSKHPIVGLSWEDAKGYCDWLSKNLNRQYDLPTEAQWEYAVRGALQMMRFPWGDSWRSDQCANAVGGDIFNGTVDVGRYPPNLYGLYDMIGNGTCWCRDWYSKDYYMTSPINNPEGPSSSPDGSKVRRGTRYDASRTFWYECASRSLLMISPKESLPEIGFRVVAKNV
jgi:formylglycine-generating enzyme